MCGVDTLLGSDTAFCRGRVSRCCIPTLSLEPIPRAAPPLTTTTYTAMSDQIATKKRKTTEEPENPKPEPAPVANLLIKRLSPKARLPTRGSALAAGYDLYRSVVVTVIYVKALNPFSALKGRLSLHAERLSSTRSSPSRCLRELTDAWPREAVSVYPFHALKYSMLTQSISVEVHDRHRSGCHRC